MNNYVHTDLYYSDSRKDWLEGGRVVIWFSCGVTSAVAVKLAIQKYKDIKPIHICYTDPGSEHEDNKRFLKDCEGWFDHEITILKSEKYKDIWEVFDKTGFLVGSKGARCTTEMKKTLRDKFQKVHSDIQVFGFDLDDEDRADRAMKFRERNSEVYLEAILLDKDLSKVDCLAIIQNAGIEIPTMYKLGYANNNCIGCVKGKAGYWNKIRIDFPEVFERMSQVEQHLGIAINKNFKKPNRGKKLFLKDLPHDYGEYEGEPRIYCGIACSEVLEEIKDCE